MAFGLTLWDGFATDLAEAIADGLILAEQMDRLGQRGSHSAVDADNFDVLFGLLGGLFLTGDLGRSRCGECRYVRALVLWL